MTDSPSFFAALRDTVRAVFLDDPPSPEEVFACVRNQRASEALEQLRVYPQSWFIRDHGGHTLLHWAALAGDTSVLEAGIAAGLPVDSPGGAGSGHQTSLMWAVSGGHVSAVRLLLGMSADPLARDSRRATVLIIAVQRGQMEVMPLLTEWGGPTLLTAGDKHNCAAAHWAAYANNVEALTMLESLGADMLQPDNMGMTPLLHAVRANRPAAASYLITRGADPTSCNSYLRNCLDIATEQRDADMCARILTEMLKFLLTHKSCQQFAPGAGDIEAGQFPPMSDLIAQTPMTYGVAVSAATAWPLRRMTAGAIQPAPRSPCSSPESPCGWRFQDLRELASFDLGYVETCEVLRAMFAKRVDDLRSILPEDLVSCFLVFDQSGQVVDLLSKSPEKLPETWFPLRARLVGLHRTDGRCIETYGMLSSGVALQMCAEQDRFSQKMFTRIPAAYRWQVWKEALRLSEKSLPRGDEYTEMAKQETEWTPLICNDICRTFQCLLPEQEQSLKRVLNAYSVLNPVVGYCQGMNMIAALLLIVSGSEEESFLVFVTLMNDLGLSEFYSEGFPRLRCYLDACGEMVESSAPRLLNHFGKEGVELGTFLQRWFLTLFIDCLPLPLVITIWDTVICEGLPSTIKVAVCLLNSLEEPMLGMRFHEIAGAFKMLRKHVDGEGEWKSFEAGHLLVRQASSIEVPERILEMHGVRLGAAANRGTRSPTTSGAAVDRWNV